ncbi:MAG: VTT domain-containing protein [Pseudohongiellaceae bacterium]
MDPLSMDPLGTLIDWVAVYGVLGLLAIGAAERFVPILPSYGVLVAIGIAAANDAWSIEMAIAATVTGSLAGCLVLFAVALAFSEEGTRRLLRGICRLLGISSAQADRTVVSFRANQRFLSFGLQLVPAVRLITPVIAGLFRADPRVFALATFIGILVWNALFIGVGRIAAELAPETSASELALKVLVALLIIEATGFMVWRRIHRASTTHAGDPQDR